MNMDPVLPEDVFKKGQDGLFLEPEDPPWEQIINNRHEAAEHFNYADTMAGDEDSFDPTGRYNCGGCNYARGTRCLLLNIKSVDLEAGSCEDWEKPEDEEIIVQGRKDPKIANYGVAKNGEGFGCTRCPYSSPTQRNGLVWCGLLAFYAAENGCCTANGVELE